MHSQTFNILFNGPSAMLGYGYLNDSLSTTLATGLH